ncbi:phosphonoacetaldehyde hydrolase [Enterococcus sp. LJL90]
MKYKGIIFDWAGTTVDDGCMAPVAAFREAFQAFDIQLTDAEIREPMGLLKKDHIRYLLQLPQVARSWQQNHSELSEEMAVEKIYQIFSERLFRDLANYAVPKAGVIEVVQELRELGVQIGSTTGYTREMMEVVAPAAKKLGFAPDVLVNPDEVNDFGRPYPYMIFENMEKMQLKSVADILKVGDTIADIQEGINAGVQTVGIIEGSSLSGLSVSEYNSLTKEQQLAVASATREKYVAAGADFVLENITELIAIVK